MIKIESDIKATYPRLKSTVRDGIRIIVLFTEPNKGVCFEADIKEMYGWSESWDESTFSDYSGTIKLSNED